MGLSLLQLSFYFLTAINAAPDDCAHELRRIMVADPVSAGAEMAQWFLSKGHRVAALFTRENFPGLEPNIPRPMRGFSQIIDEGELIQQNRHADLETLIRDFNPEAIMAGTDTAAAATAHWSNSLGIPGNPGLGRAFREKDAQAQIISGAGLRSMLGFRSSDPAAFRDWIHRELDQAWLRGPDDLYVAAIRLKPIDGAGGISHAVVRTDRELEEAVRARLGQPTTFGQTMQELLAQRNLSMRHYDEYIVETITSSLDANNRWSTSSHHRLAFIYRYQKCLLADGIKTLNQVLWLMPPEGEIQRRLIDFAQASVSAFQTRVGPTHGEFFLAKDGNEGPIFNEMGFRPGGLGGYLRKVALLSMGLDEFEMIRASYFDRRRFDEIEARTFTPAAIVKGVSRDGSRPISHAIEARIRKLPGFVEFKWKVNEGAKLLTDDTIAIAYLTVFMHDDEAVLQDSVAKILEWEQEGALYKGFD